jgi:hypothetical protein
VPQPASGWPAVPARVRAGPCAQAGHEAGRKALATQGASSRDPFPAAGAPPRRGGFDPEPEGRGRQHDGHRALGAAFAAKGYKVLLVDLELQGSLSGLFIGESNLVQLSTEKRLLQHFLLDAAAERKVNLLEHCVPIPDGKWPLCRVPTAWPTPS